MGSAPRPNPSGKGRRSGCLDDRDLLGPSIMPGGSPESYQKLGPIFESIAAQVDGPPCYTHVGPDGAGYFVKMVHNGIEYADMQLIAEAYDLLRAGLGAGAASGSDHRHDSYPLSWRLSMTSSGASPRPGWRPGDHLRKVERRCSPRLPSGRRRATLRAHSISTR